MLEDVSRRRIALPERGVEIAVLDWGGAGPPALLHHANGFCGAVWDGVARRLRPRLRAIAVDARGHGDSSRPADLRAFQWSEMAEDLAAVGREILDEIGAPRFALGLGHSFGGTLTLAAASRHPALYARIALVDPVILPPRAPGGPPPGRGNRLAEGARRRRHVWSDRAAARSHLASRSLFADWDPHLLDLYVAEGLRDRADGRVELKCAGEVEAAIFEGDQGMDVFALAARVGVPARLYWATRGNFDRAVYERLIAPMHDARVIDVDAGHLMVMEAPERVADAVLRFVDDAC